MQAHNVIKFIDYQTDQYGDYPFIRSSFQSHRKWTPIGRVDDTLDGQEVLVRARIHNVRGKGNTCFIVLRENFSTLQACAFKSETISKEMIKYMTAVPNESVVDIVGKVVKPQKPIESCSQSVELQILRFFVVNRATNRLPLQITDASRKVDHNEFDPFEEDEPEKKEEVKAEEGKGHPKVEEKPHGHKAEGKHHKNKQAQHEVKAEQAATQVKVEEGKQATSEVKEEEKGEKEKKPKKQKKKKQEKVEEGTQATGQVAGEAKEEGQKEKKPKKEKKKKQEKVEEGTEAAGEVVGEAKEEGDKEKKPKKQKKKKQEKEEAKQVKAEDQFPIVKMKTRLDNRVIDLRTTAKQAIFKLSSGVCQLFREYCLNNDFVEIHTPKLIGGSSEGGSNVFALSYFTKKACLAQSPQLYKQMCVMGDFQRVFEIGPVFRAENSFTHRHMCEFVGLDIQMSIKEHYYELLDFFGELFPFIFNNLEQRYGRELKAINEQFQFAPFKCKIPTVKLTFAEGIQLLKDNGIEWPENEDLSTEIEKKLGELVKNKYDTDFYMLHRYPVSARPFYTMLCHDDPNYTCSYDMFMRGEQILSGAQRIHDPVILKQRAIEKGIDPQTINDYIESFQYGAYPHGGGGIGLERVVMLYCALKNIRNASLFPRDPKRITP